MADDLDPEAVAARLAWLREHWTPEDPDQARRRMEPPPRAESFDRAVARRLAELRALYDLTAVLHAARPSTAADEGDG